MISQLSFRALLKGIGTFIPGVRKFTCRSSGGTVSARYCYSVWLRHLVKAHEIGLAKTPAKVAELGPGDSLGIGLAAMLSGVDDYYALDAKAYAFTQRNLDVFDELVELFLRRASVPDEVEFPFLFPYLESYEFPRTILTEEVLGASLRPERLKAIKHALTSGFHGDNEVRIFYFAPWDDLGKIRPETIDMVFSQAVMEHVEDIESTYAALYSWLSPGGFMSHTIDYKSHGYTRDWNGHWTVSEFVWRLIRGRRPYLINRYPHSAHIGVMKEKGFRIVSELRRSGPLLRQRFLAPQFKSLTDHDLQTSSAFIQAVRPV